MSDHFSDWDGTDSADDFAQPGDRGYEAPGPPSEPVAAAEAPPRDPIAQRLIDDPLGAVDVIRRYAQFEDDQVVAEAVERWESGEEDPDVIADELRDRHGYELATRFVSHWHAEDTEWQEPPAGPETALEWATREEQRLAYLAQLEQAEQAQQAQAEQAQLDAEINKAFNEGVKEARQRHIALSRGRGVKPAESLFAIINQLGASVNPRTPDEGRLTGEQLYRQAVELDRAMKHAEINASFPDDPLRLNYMPGPQELEERRNALSPDDERLNHFVKAIDVSRTTPRPTLAESLAADLDTSSPLDTAWNV